MSEGPTPSFVPIQVPLRLFPAGRKRRRAAPRPFSSRCTGTRCLHFRCSESPGSSRRLLSWSSRSRGRSRPTLRRARSRIRRSAFISEWSPEAEDNRATHRAAVAAAIEWATTHGGRPGTDLRRRIQSSLLLQLPARAPSAPRDRVPRRRRHLRRPSREVDRRRTARHRLFEGDARPSRLDAGRRVVPARRRRRLIETVSPCASPRPNNCSSTAATGRPRPRSTRSGFPGKERVGNPPDSGASSGGAAGPAST